MNIVVIVAVVIGLNLLAQSPAISTAHATAAKPIPVSAEDQIKNLRLIDSARAIENMIHRLKLEYEAKKAEFESTQKLKLEEYGKFIEAKRAEYKVGDTFEIDIDKGVWVDRKPPAPPAPVPSPAK